MTKKNGSAKYYVLMESLKNEIIKGTIKPGEKILSENKLASKFQVSRHTVRKALSILENEGLLEAIHGLGTFCTEKSKKQDNRNCEDQDILQRQLEELESLENEEIESLISNFNIS